MRNLAKTLSDYRLLERISLRAMAAKLGISASTLSRIERGEAMDGNTLAAVLRWLLNSEADADA